MVANAALGGEMFVSDARINEASDYTFEVTMQESIPDNGRLRIYFFDESNFILTAGNTYECEATYGFKTGATPRCQVDSTATFIDVLDVFQSEDFLLIFTVKGV